MKPKTYQFLLLRGVQNRARLRRKFDRGVGVIGVRKLGFILRYSPLYPFRSQFCAADAPDFEPRPNPSGWSPCEGEGVNVDGIPPIIESLAPMMCKLVLNELAANLVSRSDHQTQTI